MLIVDKHIADTIPIRLSPESCKGLASDAVTYVCTDWPCLCFADESNGGGKVGCDGRVEMSRFASKVAAHKAATAWLEANA